MPRVSTMGARMGAMVQDERPRRYRPVGVSDDPPGLRSEPW